MIFEDDLLFSLARIVLITACTTGMMSALTTLRYSVKKILLVFALFLLWVVASTAAILYFFDYYAVTRVFLLTISVPGIYLAYRADDSSPTQSVFNYATQIVLSLLLIPVCIGINTLLSGNKLTHLLVCAGVYGAVIFLEYRFLRRRFQQLLQVIQTGWGVLSLIPISYCALLAVVSSYPVHYLKNPVVAPYIVAIVMTLFVVYFTVYHSLMRQYRLQMLSRDRDVLAVQISAMNKQADAVFAAEEKLRILRHDVRHFTEAMHSLLRQGGTAQAEAVLSTLEAAVHDGTYHTYCDDYMMNSLLVPYLDAAEQEGIAVKVQFAAPPAEQIDATAFSVMLANALENALEACRQETGSRSIALKARMFHGQYLMELSNTCSAVVQFNRDGLPLSRKGEGHGIGTRSIAAFAKAQGASVDFRTENNRFILQMILGLER